MHFRTVSGRALRALSGYGLLDAPERRRSAAPSMLATFAATIAATEAVQRIPDG